MEFSCVKLINNYCLIIIIIIIVLIINIILLLLFSFRIVDFEAGRPTQDVQSTTESQLLRSQPWGIVVVRDSYVGVSHILN